MYERGFFFLLSYLPDIHGSGGLREPGSLILSGLLIPDSQASRGFLGGASPCFRISELV